MTDPTRRTDDDTGKEHDRERTGIPRWVWLVGVVAVLVALVVAVVIFAGGGHTPGPPPGGH